MMRNNPTLSGQRILPRRWLRIAILLAILLPLSIPAEAQCCQYDSATTDSSRPVTGFYNLEVGSYRALSTYLSPLTYSGYQLAASGYWTKAMPFAPESAVMDFDARLAFGDMLNPANTASMLSIATHFRWGMAWRKALSPRLQFTIGGNAGLRGGALYLLRNSNNPVTALASVELGAAASISYRFSIKRLPIILSDRASMPLLGAFFSPEYGETYYEIYLGNRSGLVHFGNPATNFALDNLLSATLDFGRTAMQIGYRFSMTNQWACHLTTRTFSHCLVIGIVPGGLGLKRHTPNIVNALYAPCLQ